MRDAFTQLAPNLLAELERSGLPSLDARLHDEYLKPIRVELFQRSLDKYVEQHKHQLDVVVRERYQAKCEEQCEYYKQRFILELDNEIEALREQMRRMRSFLLFLEKRHAI